MGTIVYSVENNDYEAKSLRELRTHIMFFDKNNDYNGAYIQRYIYRAGERIRDDNFLMRIKIVSGKVIFQRVKVYYRTLYPCRPVVEF